MTNTLKISDTSLIQELKQSALEDRQKTALEPLIKQMTDAERQELLNLIERSKEADEKGKKIYEEGMKVLNAETEKEIKEVSKELNKKALKSLEGLEKEAINEETDALEKEIMTIDTKTAVKKTIKSGSFKWIAILFISIAMALSAWFAINA